MFSNFQRWKIRSFFKPNSWWKYDIYLLMKSSCFELFTGRKNSLSLSRKVDGTMIFTDYWKVHVLNFSKTGNTVCFSSRKIDGKIIFTDYWQVLVLNFLVMGNTVFLEPKNWWKDYIYWFLKSSCFEIFGNGKYRLFFSKDVAGKMIFTWSFWAFHDIPILDKYGFSSSLKHLFKRKTLLSVTLLIKKTLRKLVIILSLHCNRLPNKIRNEMEKPTIYFRLLSFTKIWICMIVKW